MGMNKKLLNLLNFLYVMLFVIWHHLYSLKNTQPPTLLKRSLFHWRLPRFFKLYTRYQIVQSITYGKFNRKSTQESLFYQTCKNQAFRNILQGFELLC